MTQLAQPVLEVRPIVPSVLIFQKLPISEPVLMHVLLDISPMLAESARPVLVLAKLALMPLPVPLVSPQIHSTPTLENVELVLLVKLVFLEYVKIVTQAALLV